MDSHQIYSLLQDMQKDIGKVLQGQEDLKDHIDNVSARTREVRQDLSEHVNDSDAHGQKIKDRHEARSLGWIGLIVGGITAAIEYLAHRGGGK